MSLAHRLPPRIASWPERWRYEYEERAAILEFNAGVPRDEAERRAEAMIREACDAETRAQLVAATRRA